MQPTGEDGHAEGTPGEVPRLEVKAPELFTPRAVFTISLYGLILVVPVLVSMLVVSVLQLGALTFVIPLATIAAATFFLPLGFGNPCVARLVRPLRPKPAGQQEAYVVQMTRKPRARYGVLALLEDADDIGFLVFTNSALVFEGDSHRLTAPYHCIEGLRVQTAGWRALFAYGRQVVFTVAGLPEGGRFAFAERSSWMLPTSRKNARRIYKVLEARVQACASPAVPGSG